MLYYKTLELSFCNVKKQNPYVYIEAVCTLGQCVHWGSVYIRAVCDDKYNWKFPSNYYRAS